MTNQTNQQPKKLPTAYGKAKAAKAFFQQLNPWDAITRLPDSLGDFFARFGLLVNVGLLSGCLVALLRTITPYAFVPLILAVLGASLLAWSSQVDRRYILACLVSFFAALLGGIA